jgi:hypothetical protein
MAVDPLAEYAKPRPKRKHRRTAKGGIPQSNPFVEMLQDTLIEEILPKRTVIVLDDSNSVGEALQVCSAKASATPFVWFISHPNPGYQFGESSCLANFNCSPHP